MSNVTNTEYLQSLVESVIDSLLEGENETDYLNFCRKLVRLAGFKAVPSSEKTEVMMTAISILEDIMGIDGDMFHNTVIGGFKYLKVTQDRNEQQIFKAIFDEFTIVPE